MEQYLGVTTLHGKVNHCTYQLVVERIDKRLVG